ncbi:MAG: nucleotide exchange factor GrpE, partial [Synergistaceae bacterium]|nr:nucleotide exchange factor GrpE [Synergistaceae bacterium]
MDEDKEAAPETEEEQETQEPDYEAQIKDLEHDLAVSRADFYNYRQRVAKERLETRQRAKEEVIAEFLPILDNLDRALSVANAEDAKTIVTGVEMVQRQFVNVLENMGVSVIKTQGEIFDPSLHDAAGTEEVEDSEL